MSKCPGTHAEKAGYEKGCEGCPNASYCQAEKKLDPDIQIIKTKFAKVAKCLAIMSGKGGVGKSFISKNIAQALSEHRITVLIDFDLTGPSIPRLTKTETNIIYDFDNILYPIKITETFFCLSVGHFYIEELSKMNSQIKNDIIKRILKNVDLNGVECVVFDTPPGISDEHLGMINYIGLKEAILVTTPQQIAFGDVIRQVDFCKKSGIKILGILENMKKMECHLCGHINSIFEGNDQVETYCNEKNIVYLGCIPLKQEIAKKSDTGEDYYDPIFEKIAQQILDNIL